MDWALKSEVESYCNDRMDDGSLDGCRIVNPDYMLCLWAEREFNGIEHRGVDYREIHRIVKDWWRANDMDAVMAVEL